jgi:hypothetical protein
MSSGRSLQPRCGAPDGQRAVLDAAGEAGGARAVPPCVRSCVRGRRAWATRRDPDRHPIGSAAALKTAGIAHRVVEFLRPRTSFRRSF